MYCSPSRALCWIQALWTNQGLTFTLQAAQLTIYPVAIREEMGQLTKIKESKVLAFSIYHISPPRPLLQGIVAKIQAVTGDLLLSQLISRQQRKQTLWKVGSMALYSTDIPPLPNPIFPRIHLPKKSADISQPT